MMKVFFIDPMGYGNLSSYDSSLLNNIHEVDIDYFTSVKFNLKDLNAKTHKIYSYSDQKGLKKILSYTRSQIFLLKLIIKEKPKIVHFQWFKIPILDYIVIKIIQYSGVHVILTAHNILPHDSGSRYLKIYTKIYQLLDVIIVHTSATKEELISKFGITSEKINVIPHGILEMERSNQSNIDKIKSDFKKSHNLKNKVVFSILGSINKYKGVELAINAWQTLNLSKNSEIHLIIAGNGKFEQLKLLEQDDNTTIVNRFLSNDEFIALVHLSDFVLLPYLQISQSGVLLTALNEKKRIIVSKKGGLTEPFQFGNIGYILEDLTKEHLASTLKKAKSNCENLPSEETWNEIHNFYSWESIGIKTKKLYQKLAPPILKTS